MRNSRIDPARTRIVRQAENSIFGDHCPGMRSDRLIRMYELFNQRMSEQPHLAAHAECSTSIHKQLRPPALAQGIYQPAVAGNEHCRNFIKNRGGIAHFSANDRLPPLYPRLARHSTAF